jgi:hypothetical protein
MLNKQEITQKIAGIKRSATSLRDNVQTVLCNIAGHAFEHGDVTLYQKLYDATSGLNRKKMVKWVHDYGFAQLQKDGSFRLNKTARKDADFPNGEAVVAYLSSEEVPAWYADEENAAEILRALDIAQRIKSLTAQIEKARSEGRVVKYDFKAASEAMDDLKRVMAA